MIKQSRRNGKLTEVPAKNLELGRDSFFFFIKGPVVWNCLDKTAPECENMNLKGFSKHQAT